VYTLFSFLVFFIFQVASLLGVSLFWQPATRYIDLCLYNNNVNVEMWL